MRVSVCVGDYAEKPYCVPGLGRNVYCMEELSYCLRENAFLVDPSLMNDQLISWIGEACGRKELAKRLHSMLHKKGSLSAFVVAILCDTGFYGIEVVEEVEQILKQGAGLSRIERRKSQIDYLVQGKKYASAIREYDALLALWQEQEKEGEPLPAVNCLSEILHNKGVAFIGLMMYGQASECFLKAWETDGDPDYYRDYLAAKRMELPEEEYVALVSENTESYRYSLALERDLKNLSAQWEEQPEYLRLYNRRELRQNGDIQKYYEESGRVLFALKENYRQV